MAEDSKALASELENDGRAPRSFSFSKDGDQTGANNYREEEKNVIPEKKIEPEIRDIKDLFKSFNPGEEPDFRGRVIKDLKKCPLPHEDAPDDLNKPDKDKDDNLKGGGFNWRAALSQSLMFLGVQHGFALIAQKKTRQALKGRFWSDYANSVSSLGGWDDGNRFFTNYIAHPMQGALTGFIYVQNSPQARRQEFGKSGDYWRSRMKATLWSAVWSTQFEIGLISQASIGNIGLKRKQTWGDIVITPTVGSAWMIAEDALDRNLIKKIERRTKNFYIKIFIRMLFNPVRNFSNILRFKEPWYRDRPTGR